MALGWTQLVSFLLACVEKESSFAELLSRSSTRSKYAFVGTEACELLAGSCDSVETARYRALASETQQRSESLYVGWPTVVLHEPDVAGRDRRKLSPLMIVELRLPPQGYPLPERLYAQADASLHPQVLAQFGLKDENVTELLAQYPIEAAQGGVDQLAQYVMDVATAVGIPLVDQLDPARLKAVSEGEIDGFGLCNVATAFRAKSAAYHESLLSELRALRQVHPAGTAAGLLAAAVNSRDERPLCVLAPLSLNEAQEAAVESSLREPLTVVTGPPGTGKSQLVTSALASCWASGRSVLFASTNNQAVDVVVQRAQQVARGLVIRTGNRENREAAAELIRELTQRARPTADIEVLSRSAAHSRSQLMNARQTIQDRTQLELSMSETLLTREFLAHRDGWDFTPIQCLPDTTAVARRLADLTAKADARAQLEARQAHAAAEEQALMSSLHIEGWLPFTDWTVAELGRLQRRVARVARARVMRGRRLKRVSEQVRLPDRGCGPQQLLQFVGLALELRTTEAALQGVPGWHQLSGEMLAASGLQAPAGPVDAREALRRVVEFVSVEERWRAQARAEASMPSAQGMWRAAVDAENRHSADSKAFIAALVGHSYAAGRGPLTLYALARYDWSTKTGPEVYFPAALGSARAWATTSLSAGRVIPLSPGLFDLVVIDEASQCSLASALPLLYRAKRALIIGDPMQLSHISTLGQAVEAECARRAGTTADELDRARLTHRRHSLYRALEARAQRVRLLDEHYRSHPDIIGISNRVFYKGALAVLTDPSRLLDFGEHAVAWQHVAGRAVRPQSGSAFNQAEAEEVVRALDGLSRRLGSAASIGVVTPFSLQAQLIARLAEAQLSEALRRAVSLEVGTAHRFQGDERDVIIFSPVVAEGLADSSQRWLLGTPNLFNVAVTRARSYLLVVGDIGRARLIGGFLSELADYVRDLQTEKRVRAASLEGALHSDAEERLFRALVAAGLNPQAKARVAGYECDFSIGEGLVLNIECDGFQHRGDTGRLRRQDLARDHLLAQLGVRVVRFPAWRCLLEPNAVAAEAARVLEEQVDQATEP